MLRRLVVPSLLNRLILACILLAPGTPAVLSQQAAATAMQPQANAPVAAIAPMTIGAPPDDALSWQSLPTPSGTERPYPLNHSFDALGSDLGALPTNAGFEAAPTSPGTPPANADLSAAATDSGTPPTNHDFASGDFTGWTTAGSPSIQSDVTRGSWAKLSTASAAITTDAFTVDADAQGFVFDLGYLTTSSLLSVYALTGTGYSTATQLDSFYCPSTCTTGWQSVSLDATPYVGQSIKLKFARSGGQLGVDNVRTQQLLPGFSTSGPVTRATEAGGNVYARLASGAELTSAAFTIDSAAQYVSLELQKFSSSSTQYYVKVLSGVDYSTTTQVTGGALSTTGTWQTIRFNAADWRGQAIKLRVEQVTGTFGVDNVGLPSIDFPDWEVTGTAERRADGAGNHYISSGGTLTSAAFVLPASIQQLSLRYRAETASAPFFVELLHDAMFSTVEPLDYIAATDTVNWTTVTYNVNPFAGETVKLRIRQSLGRGQYDDLGRGALVIPGWTLTPSSDAIASGTDSHGSYVTPQDPQGALFLQSSPIATGIIDRPSRTDLRYYAISYEIGFSSSSLFQVFWVNENGASWTVLQTTANSPTGYRTRYFYVPDSLGTTGSFIVKSTGGGKVYSLADNVARQQVNEPFARKVGRSIDTATGSFGYSAQDLVVQGALPLVLGRYYVGQSDQYGTLGYRWSHSYDTRLMLDAADGDVGVIFGAGGEEFFTWNATSATFTAADARTHDTLVKHGDGSYTFTSTSNLAYHFSSAGVLGSISDLNGQSITLAYDSMGRLQTVTNPGGHSLTFAYDANGRLTTVTDPLNAVVTYGYDANGDLTSVTDPENGVTTYSYDQHRLTSVVDENAKTLFTNTYDTWHRVTSQADALNKTITLSYDTPGKGATRVTDPNNQQATYYFDAQQRTTAQVDPLARVISYLYDGSGNLDKIIDPANNQWEFAYDSSGNLTEQTDPLSNPVTITYNAQHLPTTVEDARGNVTTYAYDANGNLTSRTDPFNKVTTFTYDANGYLASTTNPLNETETYTNDANGNRLTRTNALGKTWTWTYDKAGRVTTETDPNGNATTYRYHLTGEFYAVEDDLGHTTRFFYDFAGNLIKVIDQLNQETTWIYDDRGLVLTKTDREGKTTSYTYDDNRNMTTVSDPLNHTTTYGYDSANRLISVTDPLNHTTSYTYDDAGRITSVTDPLSRVTSLAYDAAGNLTSLTLPNAGVYSYTYDDDGNRLTETSPLNHTRAWTFDAMSRVTTLTDALNHSTSYTYDDAGRLVAVTDALNGATTSDFDAAGQLIATTNPLNHTTTYAYDDAGRRITSTDPLNRTTTYGYDDLNRVTSITNPASQTTSYAYDAAGRLTSVTNPLNKGTTYVYDGRGLLTSSTDPLNRVTTYAYDDAGRRSAVTNPRNQTMSYGYDAAGRLTTLTDALNGVVNFGYDAAGQRTSVTNPRGKTTSYTFDALGNVLTETDPLSRVTTYSYNAAGMRTEMSDPRSISVGYGYNAAGQLTSVSFPGGSYSFAYDALGRQTSLTDPIGTTTWSYDAASRVTSVAAPQGTVSYGYDAAGQRTSMTLPGSQTVTSDYDPAGRLTELTDWSNRVIAFGYDATGRRTVITRPNGVDSRSTYDDAGQLIDITHADAHGTLESYSYSYDSTGNRTAVVSSAGTELYTFDVLNRLTEVEYPNGDLVSYTYDANGNRLTQTVNGVTATYTNDDADQLTSDGTISYGYDDAGNLESAGSDSFSWDWANRLTSATVGGATSSYTYDGTDIRVSASVGGTQTNYLWDRVGGLPLLVDDGSNAYLHADGVQASIDSAGVPTYALADGLGSVRGLTDLSGAVVGTADYDVFGAVRTSSGTASIFGFTGEQFDAATGYTFLRARYLDPLLGRFVSRDAVQPNAPGTQGYNPYAYVANNPTTWIDPSGHAALALALVGISVAAVFYVIAWYLWCYSIGPCADAPGFHTPSSTTWSGPWSGKFPRFWQKFPFIAGGMCLIGAAGEVVQETAMSGGEVPQGADLGVAFAIGCAQGDAQRSGSGGSTGGGGLGGSPLDKLRDTLAKMTDKQFGSYLLSIQGAAARAGAATKTYAETRIILDEALKRGWKATPTVETEHWIGGPHIHLIHSDGRRLHFPVPEGFTP